jgi:hypothetical protein
MLTAAQQRTLRLELESAAREIGILLLAFSPLDAMAWDESTGKPATLLRFLACGALFLGGAIVSALRRARERN